MQDWLFTFNDYSTERRSKDGALEDSPHFVGNKHGSCSRTHAAQWHCQGFIHCQPNVQRQIGRDPLDRKQKGQGLCFPCSGRQFTCILAVTFWKGSNHQRAVNSDWLISVVPRVGTSLPDLISDTQNIVSFLCFWQSSHSEASPKGRCLRSQALLFARFPLLFTRGRFGPLTTPHALRF